MNLKLHKNVLREKYKKIRENLSYQERLDRSLEICRLIEQNDDFKNAENILFFASKKPEVDLLPLLKKTINQKNIYLPCIIDNSKYFSVHKITNFAELNKGKFGILEPHEDCEIIQTDKLDLIFVPAVCIDQVGNRIGLGGGYFDHFLTKIRAKKIAVIFACQKVDKIASESHDIPVDAVVTEDGFRYF